MKRVREGLYIGALDDALEYLTGSKSGITHVLSVAALNFLADDKSLNSFAAFRRRQSLCNSLLESVHDGTPPVASEAADEVERDALRAKLVKKTLPLMDSDTQNLLDHLEVCLDFIEEGRKTGSVLVHCVAGISRSASVVTAYLMRKERLSFKDALSSLKAFSNTACPNAGFVRQLQLFEAMNFVVDKKSHIYKKFFVENLGYVRARGERVDVSGFAADPSSCTLEANKETTDSSAPVHPKLFRCKKCRRLLALQENVLSHTPGSHDKPYKWKKGESANIDNERDRDSCNSIFVEPMQWMKVEQGVLEAKLLCAGCKAKVGSYNWAGFQCSCGTWINPAFQLYNSKVDASWT